MQVFGEYKRFWGSDQWNIRINYHYELDSKANARVHDLEVEFLNIKSGLFNKIEVTDLCSCVKLMKVFADGFNISFYPKRLASWLEDYFKDNGQIVSSKSIISCLKNKSKKKQKKVDAKVKKLTIVNNEFNKLINYDPSDLLIDYDQIYGKESELNVYPLNKLYVSSLKNIELKYDLDNKEIDGFFQTTTKTQLKNGDFHFTRVFSTGKTITNIRIRDTLAREFEASNIVATLFAPDKSELGIFQPYVIHLSDEILEIVWKIEELKQAHYLEFHYIFRYRVVLVFFDLEDENNKKTLFLPIKKSIIDDPHKINIPQQELSSSVSNASLSIPIELETKTFLSLMPEYIINLQDLGNYQTISLSKIFLEDIQQKSIEIKGYFYPVVSIQTSILPAGAQIERTIFRLNSISDPLILFNYESDVVSSVLIQETYSKDSLIEFTNSEDMKFIDVTNKFEKLNQFTLSRTNPNVMYRVSNLNSDNIEVAFSKVSDIDSGSNLNVHTILKLEKIESESNDFLNNEFISDVLNEFQATFPENKIRLRTFDCSLALEQISSTESSSKMLDSAFDQLEGKESQVEPETEVLEDQEVLEETQEGIDALKELIKEKYSSTFSPETSEISTDSEDLKELDEFISYSSDLDSGEEPAVTSSDSEDLQELDDFIAYSKDVTEEESNDVFGETEEADVLDEKISTPLSSTPVTDLNQFDESNQLVSKELDETDDMQPIANNQIDSEDDYYPTGRGDEVHELINERINELDSRKKQELIGKQTKESKFIEIKVIYLETKPEKEKTDFELNSIIELDEPVQIFDIHQNKLETKQLIHFPLKLYLKVPKHERFMILLMTPGNQLSSHLYGKWKVNKKDSNFKLQLTNKGNWNLKIQLLESGDMYEYNLKLN